MKMLRISALLAANILFQVAVAHSAPPMRIVALQPSLAESAAWILGPGKISRIAGVSDYADFPPELKKAPSIGSYARFSVEKVASLKPDLVLASADGNPRDLVEKLQSLGLPVRILSMGTVQEIEKALIELSRLLGEEEGARSRIRAWKLEMDGLRAKRVFLTDDIVIQLGDAPLVVLGGKGFLNEAVEIAGARNSFRDVDLPFHRPSIEAVLSRAPKMILILRMGGELAPYERMRSEWERKTKALSKKPLIRIVSIDALVRPSPRLPEGIRALRAELSK